MFLKGFLGRLARQIYSNRGSVGTLAGVQATAFSVSGAPGGLSNKQANGTSDARVKCSTDVYTTLGSTEDATSTIKMCNKLPKGARILDVLLTISGALTSSVTLSVGDSDTAARYISVAPTTAAARFGIGTATYGVPNSMDYVIGTATGDDQILITINAANNAVAAIVIKVKVLYTMD